MPFLHESLARLKISDECRSLKDGGRAALSREVCSWLADLWEVVRRPWEKGARSMLAYR